MPSDDRVEKLLALLLLNQMKSSPQREKVQQLSIAGFTNTEIADFLRTTTGVVAQSLYESRRKPAKKKPKSSHK